MKRQVAWLVMVGLLSACIPASQTPELTGTPTQAGELIPYLASTDTPVVRQKKTASPSPLPSPRATPHMHVVKQGETVSGIALLYGVSIDAILAANPSLNPNLMVVGTALVVPDMGEDKAPAGGVLTATPLPVRLDGGHCAPVNGGGAWCFVAASNPHKVGVESVTVNIRIGDEKGEGLLSQVAFAPLNLLPAGKTLPLAVYFPAPVPGNLQVSAELLSALPVNAGDDRYLPASLVEVKTDLLPDGVSARMSGRVTLEKGSPQAQLVWVLAVAYDISGQVVGFRRWEMASNQRLKPGKQVAFSVSVYSTAGKIERVEAMAEARP